MVKIPIAIAIAIFGMGTANASPGSSVINSTMSNLSDTQVSGSGDTILDNCGASSGHQRATVKVKQKGNHSKVRIRIRKARPHTLYTVWLRIKGGEGHNNAGSPLTGGGATPLISGTDIDTANDFSPWGSQAAGTLTPINGFTTDYRGNANWSINLDFPIVRGAYPFHLTAANRPGFEGEPNVAKVIANPDDGNGGPFLFRIVSHCSDSRGHGLSPGTRESWFQYP